MRVLGGWLIGAILLIGCNANDDHNPAFSNEAVKFNSWLSEESSSVSRASEAEGTASLTKEEWKAGDGIGVYMMENGRPLAEDAIVERVVNNKYLSTEEGKNSVFIAASEDDEIYYPYNSPAISFVAYYPYKSTITADFLYPIDVSDQKEDPSKVDLLYATLENKSPENLEVPLTFHHQLTKLVVNLHPNFAEDMNAPFKGVKVRVKGFFTKANYSLANAGVISNLDGIADISAKTVFVSDGGEVRAEVILIPQTTRDDAYIEIDLLGKVVVWKIPENKSFEAGKQYEYTAYLEKSWIKVDEEKISPWGAEIPVAVNWESSKYIPINLVKIQGADALIGSPKDTSEAAANEFPQHTVSVGTFWIGSYEITNKQYVDFLNAVNADTKVVNVDSKGYGYDIDIDGNKVSTLLIDLEENAIVLEPNKKFSVNPSWKNNFPVTNVTWYGAKAFAQWLGGDLPSEAEWETACRAGNYDLFSFSGTTNNSNNIYYAKFVNCKDELADNGTNEVLLVNALSPNKIGLYNMHGNVYEWCRDAVGRNAEGGPAPYNYRYSGDFRVLRGGSYQTPLKDCRSASRICVSPEYTDSDIGFRVVFLLSNAHNVDFKKIEKVLSIDIN
jgi:formylglycine-generating enzyme required for sulfatase activity